MMKKQYVNPQIKKIVVVSNRCLLSGSYGIMGDAPNGAKAFAPRRGVWDDDEDSDY